VPKLSAPNEQLEELAHAAHGWLFWTLIVLVLVHAAAALYHHYVRRDATLVRMLPSRWRPQVPPAKESNDVV
jgi:cytochrome b561